MPVTSFGQTKIFVKEYTYELKDEDSQNSAKIKAQEQLRKLLLTEVLGYVRKSNAASDLSSSDISVNLYKESITANTRDKMKILEEKFDGFEYRIKAEMGADIAEINAYAAEKNRINEQRAVATAERTQTTQATQVTQMAGTVRNVANNAVNAVENVDRAAKALGGLGKVGGGIGGALGAAKQVKSAVDNTLDAVENVQNIAGAVSRQYGQNRQYEQNKYGDYGANAVENYGAAYCESCGRKFRGRKYTQRYDSGRMFVFSTRSEYFFGDAHSTRGFGVLFEWGVIGINGFYFSYEFGGGVAYIGNGFNFGGCINKDGTVKNVLGVTAGPWYSTVYNVHNTVYNFGGVFWKSMFGYKGNFDITSKWLFGKKLYDYDYDTHSGFNLTYSLSVGGTLTKRRR